MAVKQNYVTTRIKEKERKLGKKITEALKPEDKFKIGNTGFEVEANQQEIEIFGTEIDNNFLRELGFKPNPNGELALPTSMYEAEIADNGEIIRRRKGSRILTENKEVRDNER